MHNPANNSLITTSQSERLKWTNNLVGVKVLPQGKKMKQGQMDENGHIKITGGQKRSVSRK